MSVKARYSEALKREFSNRLAQKMADLMMNQSDLARATGLSKDAISTYWRGKSIPEPKNLAKIAKVLKCEAGDLVSNDQRTNRPPPVQVTYSASKEGFARLQVDKEVPVGMLPDFLALLAKADKEESDAA